jgi:uncharacterized protein (TIGR01777 family)
MARTVITGATGTIGGALTRALVAQGDQVVALSRDPDRARGVLSNGIECHAWPDPKQAPPPAEALSGAGSVIHLLGEPIAQRWNDQVKREIEESRVLSTRMLVRAINDLPPSERPAVLVSQSAIGYYGPHGDEPVDEDAAPGSDFLAGVVVAWEKEAHGVEGDVRVTTTRTGVVLSPSGGALGTMLPFFRLGLGGPVAGGRQYVPWVHLDDVVGALMRCAADAGLAGAVNISAPNPVTNRELTRSLARTLHRPAIFPVPAAALRVLYGDMAQIVTTGARVIPRRLQDAGYGFAYPELDPALRDLLG